MEDLTIEIHGPRSEGKSTLAIFIRELINEASASYFVPRTIKDTGGMKGRYNQVVQELNENPMELKQVRIAVCVSCSTTGLCEAHENAS